MLHRMQYNDKISRTLCNLEQNISVRRGFTNRAPYGGRFPCRKLARVREISRRYPGFRLHKRRCKNSEFARRMARVRWGEL